MKLRTLACVSSLALLVASGLAAQPRQAQAAPAINETSGCSGSPTILGVHGNVDGGMIGIGPLSAPVFLPMAPPPILYTSPLASTVVSFGYFTHVQGIPQAVPGLPAVIQGGFGGPAGALFTYYATGATTQDATSGNVRNIVYSGTMTIYGTNGLSAAYFDPTSFAEGFPLLTATFTDSILVNNGLQIIPNMTGYGSYQMYSAKQTFTSTSLNSITSSAPFTFNGACYQFGTVGQQFTQSSTGVFDAWTPLTSWTLGTS
jgi:hypothetical protein